MTLRTVGFLCLGLLVGACGTAPTRDGVYYPFHRQRGPHPQAELTGRLIVQERCLLIVEGTGPRVRKWLPIWPPGTSFNRDQWEAVVDGDGTILLRVGEIVSLGGHGVLRARAQEIAAVELPADCGDPLQYWISSEIDPAEDRPTTAGSVPAAVP